MAVIEAWHSDYAFSETLDASGNTTDFLMVRNFSDHTIAFNLPAGVNAVVRIEGSLDDGLNGFGVDSSGNEPGSGGDLLFTGEGMHSVVLRNTPLNFIRLKLVSYSGEPTLAGITGIRYRGGLR